jgi:hypothetical protein
MAGCARGASRAQDYVSVTVSSSGPIGYAAERMTGQMTNFVDFRGTRFVPFLLPIIPVGSKLSEGSKPRPEMLGKIPGRPNDDGTWACMELG